MTESIDVVYTWVDDQQPGYAGQLAQHARKPRDRDPARTRDTLETLRYSLRSLERFAPWVNHIHLLTCRPQVPPWLDTAYPKISVVHHDQVMPASALPTFNSLAIISHLHLIPNLTQRFLYIEDDMVFAAPVTMNDFIDGSGRLRVFAERHFAPRRKDIRNTDTSGGWNLALAESMRLLDQKYGAAQRRQCGHSPLLIDKSRWVETLAFFPEVRDATIQSRFRGEGNMAPEFLYAQCLLAEGKAVLVPRAKARKTAGYIPLEDFWPATLLFMTMAHLDKPKWLTLNDNFGPKPSRITTAMVRRLLDYLLPEPSSFERRRASAAE